MTLPGRYSADDTSQKTLAECEAAVGRQASLMLTGTIVEAGESSAGAYVKFEPDPRWGFALGTRFVMDLDPFDVA